MPNSPVVPTIRRRRLGVTLKRLRNDAGLTLDEAAGVMGWKAPKLSKIENAVQSIRPAEVTGLLETYGVSDPEVFTALEGLARDAGKKGWWQTYGDVVFLPYADYISLETDAQQIWEWSPLLVPGLLQTAAYARETIAGATTSRTTEEVGALVEVRQARQAILSKPEGALEFWAILHEAALHQRFAIRPNTMRDQLRRLLEVSELPNVTLQVMPLDSASHPGLVGGFSLVHFPGPMPNVVLLENVMGATYVEGGNDTVHFTKAFERIRATALPVQDSLALIARLEEGHRT
ncbi:helix-turn-helix domain-containing protein [Streptomyces alkaliphilus]|uniref:helix-turn-helix domain-containing protein n=1 Tax=Streptomyces alkaliphilus TaxID=1472722 RepID=UPI00117CC469|nr:helix-turn-helix transcriptional regulator [Streptomyces alkaliphilus]MQS06212.1 helix-turn-helix domain-containing protein [Streptomyces alkaliphilus]